MIATKKPVNAFTDFPTPIHGEFLRRQLALACFVALVRLVDDVYAAAAFDNLAVTVAFFYCFQRVNDFHVYIFLNSGRTLPKKAAACQHIKKDASR